MVQERKCIMKRDAESKQHKKWRTVSTIIQSCLIVILIVLVGMMMFEIEHLQGTARVINYAGLVRGATQREMKLEMSGCQNDELIQYLDDILSGLKYEDGNYDLISLDDKEYQKKLDEQIHYWADLKEEIQKVRDVGYQRTNIVDMSEKYFHLADETVSAAENYSEKMAKDIRVLEIVSAIDMFILFCIVLEQMISGVRIAKKNKILEQRAYLDVHTGLPNKSKCEELLHDMRLITEPVACVMFDLNNLKKANDTMGHSAGDQLIANFARILRNVVPAKDFVGRYGGDEFIAVIYDTDKEHVQEILNQLQEEVDQFNMNRKSIPISFAQGCGISTDYKECTLRTLFDKADYYMYENKQKTKAGRKDII